MLTEADEGLHHPGPSPDWSESRYVDVYDPAPRVGAWLRLGCRPNQSTADVSVCVYLPDGRVAVRFDRSDVRGHGMAAAGLEWQVVEPFRRTCVRYEGDVIILEDPWSLADPGPALRAGLRVPCTIELACRADGLGSVMGFDQAHIDRIFLPGQADHHYQHLVRSTGTITVGAERWHIDGSGGKDQSWGPRNWHAKSIFRWLIAAGKDGSGFMVTRGVGPTAQRRGGFVWDGGRFHLVDDFAMDNTFAGPPHFGMVEVGLEIRSGDRRWSAVGRPLSWVPLRHRQAGPDGTPSTLRIVKSPMEWVINGDRHAMGMAEYHDLMEEGRPVGLHE